MCCKHVRKQCRIIGNDAAINEKFLLIVTIYELLWLEESWSGTWWAGRQRSPQIKDFGILLRQILAVKSSILWVEPIRRDHELIWQCLGNIPSTNHFIHQVLNCLTVVERVCGKCHHFSEHNKENWTDEHDQNCNEPFANALLFIKCLLPVKLILSRISLLINNLRLEFKV